MARLGNPAPTLAQLVEAELFRSPPKAAALVSEQIVDRHSDAVAAVLFYGSCLRRDSAEGVLDFYALVDDYGSAYASRALAWANAVLPPNVFYLEIESEIGRLRAKYAVVSTNDFERGVRPGGMRSSIWARFCQPAMAVRVRDEATRERVTGAVCEAIVTAVDRVVGMLADTGGTARFDAETLWQRVLHETYASEWRPEAPETVRSLVDADPARYRDATQAALEELSKRSRLSSVPSEQGFEVCLTNQPRQKDRGLRRPLAKFIYLLGLLKSAATFGDWLPYALWKLERHTGKRIELSERQRRHPFLWGWPVLLRVIRRRDLR